MQKPKLDEFLKVFTERIHEVNEGYHDSKQQFECEMKKFRDFSDLIDD